MLTNINYSIIIPHKNSAGLLQRCLDSIPQRDDIQIIVVDDASLNIETLQDVEKKYPYVEVVYTIEGYGAGYARNIGLDKAIGKWVLFADADDFFNQGFLEYLDKYVETENDIVFFNSDSRISDTLQPCISRLDKQDFYIKEKDIDSLRFMIPVVWGKMYSLKFVRTNRIYFEEVVASNDVWFSFMAGLKAQKMGICDFCLYCSTINRKSLCYSQDKNILDSRFFVGLHINILKHKEGVLYSQNNLLSCTMYYHNYGTKTFIKALMRYLTLVPLKMIWWDIKISIPKLWSSIKKRRLIEFK